MGKRSKDHRDDRLGRGDAILMNSGIDLDSSDEELLPRLLAMVGKDPDADLSIADHLGSIALEESVEHLAAWEAKAPPDRDLRRVIRSSLFRLSQRGVAGADKRRAAGEPVRLTEVVEPSGHLSPLDGDGNRLAWVARPRPGGGLIILSSLINDRSGMLQIGVRHANRTQFREALADVGRKGAPMVEAPNRYVDWLMHEAHQRGTPRDEPPGGYPLMRSDFYETPPEPVDSPVHAMMQQRPDDPGRISLEDSEKLLAEREFLGWVVPDDLVSVHQARFRDAQVSTLVLEERQMQERLRGIVDGAFDEVFQSPARALYARRLEEMALWFLLARRESIAGTCYAMHLALADPARSLRDISFLRGITLRAFLHLMPRGDAKREEPADPSSLIVPPD
ncbi:MAG: hypothetical protein ACE5HU_07605 [Acidobacteriota bacterium]